MTPDEEAMQEEAIQDAAEDLASSLGGSVAMWRRVVEGAIHTFDPDAL